MSLSTRAPVQVTRCVQLAGVFGILIGLIIASVNEESFSWGLLRGAVLGLIFAFIARRFLVHFLRYWLETKIEALTEQRENRIKEQGESQPSTQQKPQKAREVRNVN